MSPGDVCRLMFPIVLVAQMVDLSSLFLSSCKSYHYSSSVQFCQQWTDFLYQVYAIETNNDCDKLVQQIF